MTVKNFRKRRTRRRGGATTEPVPKVFCLNVLDPAVANKFTLDLPDKTGLPRDNWENFNDKRLTALVDTIHKKINDGYVVMLQEVCDALIYKLFGNGNMDLGPAPPAPKRGTIAKPENFSVVKKVIQSRHYLYYRSYMMLGNAQQGLLIACNKEISEEVLKGNKAVSAIIGGIRYATAHFPGTGNYYEYLTQLKNDVLGDVLTDKCIFGGDMNYQPKKMAKHLTDFNLCEQPCIATTTGVKIFIAENKYKYIPPDIIDAIWVSKSLNIQNPTVEVIELNDAKIYISDHNALQLS